MMPGTSAGGAPPALPIGSLVTAAAVLLGGAVYLLLEPSALTGHVANPRLLALTHTFTLGFVTLVFLGTLQQLPAVMLVTELAWPRLGFVSLPLAVVGIGLMVFGFADGVAAGPLTLGGSLVCLALGLSLAQLLATAARKPPREPAGRGLVAAVVYLFLTVLAGLLLASARAFPGVAASVGYSPALHQTFGLLGGFLLGIAAAGHKLLSMFALSKGGPLWRLRWLSYLVLVALSATLLGAFWQFTPLPPGLEEPLRIIALAGIVAAAGLQLWEVKALLDRRLRKKLEAPVMRFVGAHLFLPVAGLLLLFGFDAAAAAAFLLGFVGLAVSGMLVKILSFLTWTSVYARRSAATGGPSARPPLLRDLMAPRLEPVTTSGLAAGALLVPLAMITASTLLATLGAACLIVGASSQLAQVLVIVYRTLRGAATPAPSAAQAPAVASKG